MSVGGIDVWIYIYIYIYLRQGVELGWVLAFGFGYGREGA